MLVYRISDLRSPDGFLEQKNLQENKVCIKKKVLMRFQVLARGTIKHLWLQPMMILIAD